MPHKIRPCSETIVLCWFVAGTRPAQTHIKVFDQFTLLAVHLRGGSQRCLNFSVQFTEEPGLQSVHRPVLLVALAVV